MFADKSKLFEREQVQKFVVVDPNRRNSKNLRFSFASVKVGCTPHAWQTRGVCVDGRNSWKYSFEGTTCQNRAVYWKFPNYPKATTEKKWMAVSTVGGCDNHRTGSMVMNPRGTTGDRFGKEFYHKAGRVSWTSASFASWCSCGSVILSIYRYCFEDFVWISWSSRESWPKCYAVDFISW